MLKALSKIYAVFLKDLKGEFLTRYSLSSAALFVFSTLTILFFSLAGQPPDYSLSAGLLWVAIFFGTTSGLAKSFISEEERGCALLLKLSVPGYAVYFGKLMFNLLLGFALNFLAVVLFLIFLWNGAEILWGTFIAAIALGTLGLAAATTIISSIISKANSKNALLPVLALPVVLPLIRLVIDATKIALRGDVQFSAGSEYLLLIAYSGVLITVSYLLFDAVWQD